MNVEFIECYSIEKRIEFFSEYIAFVLKTYPENNHIDFDRWIWMEKCGGFQEIKMIGIFEYMFEDSYQRSKRNCEDMIQFYNSTLIPSARTLIGFDD